MEDRASMRRFKRVAMRKSERRSPLYLCTNPRILSPMSDQPDPPRKMYGFKSREFDRANDPPAPPPPSPAVDPGIVAGENRRIDVRDLIRSGAGKGPQLGSNAAANRANEVHAMLQDNL